MNKPEFMDYLNENFSLTGEEYRFINNILDFVANNYTDENEQYLALSELFENTIGLSDNEIRQICLE